MRHLTGVMKTEETWTGQEKSDQSVKETQPNLNQRTIEIVSCSCCSLWVFYECLERYMRHLIYICTRHSENVYLNDMWINELMIGRCLIRLSDCQRKENEQMRCFEEPLISASESVTKGSSWYAIASKVGVADTAFFKKNEYIHWMNNQIIFSMNKFFEWIFCRTTEWIFKWIKKCDFHKKN